MYERRNTPNGLAVKKLYERVCHVFGQQEYVRLAAVYMEKVKCPAKSRVSTPWQMMSRPMRT